MQLPSNLLSRTAAAARGSLSYPVRQNILLYFSPRKKMNSYTSLLVLILRNVLSETAQEKPPQGFRYASYEVTIPRKVMPRYGEKEYLDTTYFLQIEGKGHIVRLRKKSFFPKNIPVFTYTKKGHLQVDYPFIRSDCFYQGFVEGKPSSLVTLNICLGGLRGLLRLENKTYEIEPIQASPTFQHVVYQLEEEEGDIPMKCGLTEEMQNYQKAMIQNAWNREAKSTPEKDWWTHTRYVKVSVVVEHERYVKFNRNKTLTAIQVLNIIHTANSFYEPLSVQISLAGLEIWSEVNLIDITNNIMETLGSFNRWRAKTLNKRLASDVGHLFAYKSYGTTLGLAGIGTVCNLDYGGAVVSYMTSSLFFISNTFAHELGHNLGMFHDGQYCTCDRYACVMAAFQANTDKFSNCSYRDYFKLRNSHCLLIPPNPKKMYKVKYCGNKIVENGEQCDCGSEPQCKLDPCCQSDCKLRSGATCAFGQCCSKCQYLPAHSICRENISICDLPEYCNGSSERCPEDVHVQDGAPCNDGAQCYHGNCTTHNSQCKMIFGPKATTASEDCFREMNAQGDRFGNCGLESGIYKKCHAQNILCGRLQCEHIDNLPSLEEHSTIVQSQIGSSQCWGTDYHSGVEIPDIGAVIDGTPCGKDRMCINGECVNVSFLKYDCNLTKCSNRGICNTHKHCHCDCGWAPPDCFDKGYGGSIDSGPPPPRKCDMNVANTDRYAKIAIGSVLSAAAFGVGLALFSRKKLTRRLQETFHPAEAQKEGSAQEATDLNNVQM
ncbi:disintegrin and metalloproteinase domain-containing protein 20 [Pogona vitticeps]